MKENSEISELVLLCQLISSKLDRIESNSLNDIWLPKKTVMRFFDYGETQMRQLEKENKLIVSKIKARKFYAVQSILELLEINKINKNEPLEIN